MRRNVIWPCRGIIIALILWLFSACIIWADDITMFEFGNDLLRKQNYPEALRAYEAFIKENAEHRLTPAAKWTMANIYFAINKDYKMAVELFQRIVNENLDTEWEIFGYSRLGHCFEEQQKWKKAAEIYQTTVRKLSASSEDAVIQERVSGLKRRLLSCYRNMNDHESIIGIYQEILTENPAASSAAEDQFHLAQVYLDMKNLKEAAENFILVVERYPASNFAQRVQSEQADFLASQCNYDWTAFSTYQSALRLSQAGQYEEALAKFDEVIKTKPNTGMAHGATLQKQFIEYRKSGDAAALREKLVSSRDDYPYGIGGVPVGRLNYFLQMIVEAQQALASNSEDVGAYARMGQGYYQTQAYYIGIETFKKAITIAPNTPSLYNMLGYCYISVQNYDEAISTFQKLIDVDPENPNSYDSMAECYYHKGDTTMAIQFYQRSSAVDSSFSNPYYMLGRIYQELGQKEKAIEHLEKYLEIDPNGFQSQSTQSLLNQLK